MAIPPYGLAYNDDKGASRTTIYAIYENGVFRPLEKVALPDGCEVEVEIRQVIEPSETAGRLPDLPKWTGQVFGRLTREELYDSGA